MVFLITYVVYRTNSQMHVYMCVYYNKLMVIVRLDLYNVLGLWLANAAAIKIVIKSDAKYYQHQVMNYSILIFVS